jgi:hypothetical protein
VLHVPFYAWTGDHGVSRSRLPERPADRTGRRSRVTAGPTAHICIDTAGRKSMTDGFEPGWKWSSMMNI